MTCLLTLPSTILDQTFPRSREELERVSFAIGSIAELCASEEATLILTDLYSEFLLNFEWRNDDAGALLNEIHVALMKFSLYQGSLSIFVKLADVPDCPVHPLPKDTSEDGVAGLWQMELGKLLLVHDECTSEGRFFIGIACDRGFSKDARQPKQYSVGAVRAFPLVGPRQLEELIDAYEWDVPIGSTNTPISFAMAYASLKVIGATKINMPTGSSHYKVEFVGTRPWVLDRNDDPLPERYLRQLQEKTGYPILVIKFALTHGKLPRRKLRIEAYVH